VSTLRCANCGYLNDPGDVVCMGCGWPIADDADTEEVED
jgi:hypothetical protein